MLPSLAEHPKHPPLTTASISAQTEAHQPVRTGGLEICDKTEKRQLHASSLRGNTPTRVKGAANQPTPGPGRLGPDLQKRPWGLPTFEMRVRRFSLQGFRARYVPWCFQCDGATAFLLIITTTTIIRWQACKPALRLLADQARSHVGGSKKTRPGPPLPSPDRPSHANCGRWRFCLLRDEPAGTQMLPIRFLFSVGDGATWCLVVPR